MKSVSLAILALLAPPPAASLAQGLPRGDVFQPLIADPKEPEFLLSYFWMRSDLRNTAVGAIGLGQAFGLMRWPGARAGDGLQLSLSGAVFAQFDMQTASHDLLNTDYLIGLPVTYRRGAFSARARLYHQSSHLGDEYLMNTQPPPTPINLNFEGLELLLARELGPLRLYGGGEYIARHAPPDLKPGLLHGGVEFRQRGQVLRLGTLARARLLAALDVRSWQQQDWRPGWSGRAGLEFAPIGQDGGLGERLALLVQVYDGPSPYGQFYMTALRSIGLGAHFRI